MLGVLKWCNLWVFLGSFSYVVWGILKWFGVIYD